MGNCPRPNQRTSSQQEITKSNQWQVKLPPVLISRLIRRSTLPQSPVSTTILFSLQTGPLLLVEVQRGAQSPKSGACFGCNELAIYGIRLLANWWNSPRRRGGPVCLYHSGVIEGHRSILVFILECHFSFLWLDYTGVILHILSIIITQEIVSQIIIQYLPKRI